MYLEIIVLPVWEFMLDNLFFWMVIWQLSVVEIFFSIKRMKDYCTILATVKRDLRQPALLVWKVNLVYLSVSWLVSLTISELSKPFLSPILRNSSWFGCNRNDREESTRFACTKKGTNHSDDAYAELCPITNTSHANVVVAILMLSEAGLCTKHLIKWKNKEG